MPIKDVLLPLVGEPSAPGLDAIVMDAYHHARLNEVIGGGLTTIVIGPPPRWATMSH